MKEKKKDPWENESEIPGESVMTVLDTEDGDEPEQYIPGEKKIIGPEEVREAAAILKKYKQGKANLDRRVIENEQWWKMRHWDYIRDPKAQTTDKDGNFVRDEEPTSAWLFNSIANKHADAMDNYPEPNVLPRAKDDEEAATQLSTILPTLLDYNGYQEVYSETWWYKLKQGTGIKGVFWNPRKNNGLGDVDIKMCDILNLFWEPGIKDIQDSRHLFHVMMEDTDRLKEAYPNKDIEQGMALESEQYIYDDNVDPDKKSVVVDWYYKKTLETGKTVVHYVKFVNETVLYASENDEEYSAEGFYAHGMYPFVFDKLFPIEGSPCGFGYIDVMRDTQKYIDILNQMILKNAAWAAKKRYFATPNAGVNFDDFKNPEKDIIEVQSVREDVLREISVEPLPASFMNILQSKIEELKETSGNRDFSQGSTSSGVTAASAIAALIEAGSKLSRDMIGRSYDAFSKECYLIIELMRQFYDLPRYFRITGQDKQPEYVVFDNSMMGSVDQGEAFGEEMGERQPVFDITVSASKKSMYSRMSQNELALQLFGLGIFHPDMTDQALMLLEIMDFEGKDKIIEMIKQNGTMADKIAQMGQQMLQMGQIIDQMSAQMGQPSNVAAQVAAEIQGSTAGASMPSASAAAGVDLDNGAGEPGVAVNATQVR